MNNDSFPANVGSIEGLGVSVPERDILWHSLDLGRTALGGVL